ncbi:uncharacterized protein LOC112345928 [Selaginella moellendorffii]|uniref:uncharacterized protein LOC112345928 n=1 Tax=Selaginella moellendorffii TaxID=88036 RepID=UPI000D1CA958|nr:uncharacterized protein LOC112345928 [Selaginella moellendorffii]|eukprot:XP_024529422.1 uncharacterized protein LOC112345928 [Selaginella moellendorffii]
MDSGQGGKLNRFLRSCGFGGAARQHHSSQPAAASATAAASPSARNPLDDCLECPVCWENFNGGDHTPYVLFCGHTLCKTCLMGLQWGTIKPLQLQLPLLVPCPWCQFLTLRLSWKGGRLKFPAKNFFLLSIVEAARGSSSAATTECSKPEDHVPASRRLDKGAWRMSDVWQIGLNLQQRRVWHEIVHDEWNADQVLKLIRLIAQVISKLPPMILLLFLVFYVLPFSALVLVLYSLVTLVFAVPCYLVLYFSYPGMQWLAREIVAA